MPDQAGTLREHPQRCGDCGLGWEKHGWDENVRGTPPICDPVRVAAVEVLRSFVLGDFEEIDRAAFDMEAALRATGGLPPDLEKDE